jgi:hypothetical protein
LAVAIENLSLVPALSVQLWLDNSLDQLGFDFKRPRTTALPAVVCGPFFLSIWSDVSNILQFEDWDAANAPRSLHYLCGVYPTELHKSSSTEPQIEERALAQVRQMALDWLNSHAAFIWPKGASVSNPQGIDWQVLHDEQGRSGEARFDGQYFRSNIDPSECCVASHKDTTRYRLRADEAGFENLYLAGTWVRTGLNVESVEGAVMSGMQAARAISGSPNRIVGEYFLQLPPTSSKK